VYDLKGRRLNCQAYTLRLKGQAKPGDEGDEPGNEGDEGDEVELREVEGKRHLSIWRS
jgi:hypothetical protein